MTENICKAKESNPKESKPVPAFADKEMNCKGVAKRKFFDKSADDRLKKEYYENTNKISEIDFQLTELRKIKPADKKKDGDKQVELESKKAEANPEKTEESKTSK